MDDIKDISKTVSLSRFLDGHIVRTMPFGRNTSGEKSYRRAERLVAALHILTSHVQRNEPIRISIRATAIHLLSDILALRDEMRIPNSEKVRAAQATIRELISLVRMLAVSGLVSTQNADIIVEAIDDLGNFLILSQRTSLSESTLLSREELLPGPPISEKKERRFIKDKAAQQIGKVADVISDITDSEVIKDISKDTERSHSRTVPLGTRSREILNVLKTGNELGIRDISSNLPEYSEKMIQRELAALVSSGFVKKAGLKRWSRYSVISR